MESMVTVFISSVLADMTSGVILYFIYKWLNHFFDSKKK